MEIGNGATITTTKPRIFPGSVRLFIVFLDCFVFGDFFCSTNFNHITTESITLQISVKFTKYLKFTKIEYYIESKAELQRQETGKRS